MRPERPEPILPARDLDETRAFYEKLGFTPWWGARGPWEYEIVSRGHLVVHFFAAPGLTPSENATSCYWRAKDADQFYQELVALDLPSEGIPRLTAPADRPWGMREFALVDPSGNLVRVGHDLDADSAYVPRESEGLTRRG
jgi:catechol 2,3-dioxygenase-like lactoylglutathione lyase family enzyme